jgi:hypothetical protein
MSGIELCPYQQEALDAIVAAIEDDPKMLSWLQRWHLAYRADTPAGDASDLLNPKRLRRLNPGGKVRRCGSLARCNTSEE